LDRALQLDPQERESWLADLAATQLQLTESISQLLAAP
jgi:hypothetical protein